MEELLERIATALETGNILTTSWIELNKQWRQEDVEKGEREAALGLEWLEWQKQQKMEERAQLEHLERVLQVPLWFHIFTSTVYHKPASRASSGGILCLI